MARDAALFLCLVVALPTSTWCTLRSQPRVVGWYTGANADYPPEAIDFTVVTHLTYHGPSVEADGTVNATDCLPAAWSDLDKRVHSLAKQHGCKIQSRGYAQALLANESVKAKFLSTVKDALAACEIDGLEFDFEGPSTPEMATEFTQLLIDLKAALGPTGVVSADSEPPQWSDYYRLNASMMDGSNIDFVNYMAYFDSTENSTIERWVNSVSMLLKDGYPPSTINIAIPYFTGNSAWRELCPECPDLPHDSNNCSGHQVVGKKMNQEIGALVYSSGIGGVFPWMLDYDASPTNNTRCGDNSLLKWLKKGLTQFN